MGSLERVVVNAERILPRQRILIVDDERSFLDSTVLLLRERGYECDAAPDAETARAHLSARSYEVVVVDLVMGSAAGLDLARAVLDSDRPPAVILMTGYPSLESAIEAVDLGLFAYLVKPFELDELVSRIDEALERVLLQSTLEQSRADLKALSSRLESLYAAVASNRRPPGPGPAPATRSEPWRAALTPREEQLVDELLDGYRVSTIARRLGISPHTVRRHLKSIFLKLEVGSQAELLEKLKP